MLVQEKATFYFSGKLSLLKENLPNSNDVRQTMHREDEHSFLRHRIPIQIGL